MGDGTVNEYYMMKEKKHESCSVVGFNANG